MTSWSSQLPPGKDAPHFICKIHYMFVFTSYPKKKSKTKHERERENFSQLKSEKLIQLVIDKSEGYAENLTHLNKSLLKLKEVVSVGSWRAFSVNDLPAQQEKDTKMESPN